MIKEGKETSLSKETIRHGHLDWLHVRHGLGAFAGASYTSSLIIADSKGSEALVAGVATFDPLLHYKAA